MNFEQMAKRCPESKVLGVGILEDYKLSFRGEGYANISVCEGSNVPIVLSNFGTSFKRKSIEKMRIEDL